MIPESPAFRRGEYVKRDVNSILKAAFCCWKEAGLSAGSASLWAVNDDSGELAGDEAVHVDTAEKGAGRKMGLSFCDAASCCE